MATNSNSANVSSWRTRGEEVDELTIIPSWGADAVETTAPGTSNTKMEVVEEEEEKKKKKPAAPASTTDETLSDIMGPPPNPTRQQTSAAASTSTTTTSRGSSSRGMGSILNRLVSTGEIEDARRDLVVGRSKDARYAQDLNKEGDLVKLEYRDDAGRLLTPHEAFRQLTYAFHGQGPSARKKEARIEQIKKASSSSSSSSTGNEKSGE